MYRMYGIPKTLTSFAGQALPRGHGRPGAATLGRATEKPTLALAVFSLQQDDPNTPAAAAKGFAVAD